MPPKNQVPGKGRHSGTSGIHISGVTAALASSPVSPALRSALHPAERFAAPGTIQKGIPLKQLISPRTVQLWAESFEGIHPAFDSEAFCLRATTGLEDLGLMERAAHAARALIEQLPADFDAAALILVASMGPELKATEGNGLAPFFYLLHSHVIAENGVTRFESGLQACYELTKRFTAEFCIRPFVLQHQQKTLRKLLSWTQDPDPHVRRLVSEGTRPRLPWGGRLTNVQRHPELTLPLLEKLKDDPELYVRRSVANHLADLLKDHPQVITDICQRWILEVQEDHVAPEIRRSRFWMVRHAVRLPAKKGDPVALKIRQLASDRAGRR